MWTYLIQAIFHLLQWSYGVLIWEVFNTGQIPFDGLAEEDIKKIVLAGDIVKLLATKQDKG
jgi:hypothetical protein